MQIQVWFTCPKNLMKPIMVNKVQLDKNNWDEIIPLWLMKCYQNMPAAAWKGAEKVGMKKIQFFYMVRFGATPRFLKHILESLMVSYTPQ